MYFHHHQVISSFIFIFYVFIILYIPLTNWVRGPFWKLWTEFFPHRIMALSPSARAINRREKTRIHEEVRIPGSGTASNFWRAPKRKRFNLKFACELAVTLTFLQVLIHNFLWKLSTLGNKSGNVLATKTALTLSGPYSRLRPAILTNHTNCCCCCCY